MPFHPPASSNLRRGDPATGHYFTPIVALAKYPYRHCDRDVSQDIASRFFDAGKFWSREWELYYVWDIEAIKPLILVPEYQFEVFIHEINSVLNLNLAITPQQREEGLVGRFPDHPRCVPRYLGRSSNREEYNSMVTNAPGASYRTDGEGAPPALEGRTLADFKKLVEDMLDAQKNKNKAAKERKQQLQIVKRQAIVQAFKRAQRYLGLRPTEQEALTPIDPDQPVTFPFDQSVVFVSVDVESYEKAHHKITEIGIASLDTRELVGLAPGKDGEHWRTKVRARHFRINEYKHLVNHEFVHGCPDRFEFGTSEFVPLADAATRTAACFKIPFCAYPASEDQEAFNKMIDEIALGEERKLIFLGHDTFTDVNYLQTLGFDPLQLPNLLETLDSAALYRVWKREQNNTNLGRILADFDIVGWNLHNAGNDAVYTVHAMLGVCVREASIRGSAQVAEKNDENKALKRAVYVADAEMRAKEEAEGWSENDDNGGPPQLVIPTPKATVVNTASSPIVSTRGGRIDEPARSNPFSPPHVDGGRRRQPGPGREGNLPRFGGDGTSDYSGRQEGYSRQNPTSAHRPHRGGSHAPRANYTPRDQPHQRSGDRGRPGRGRGHGRGRGAPLPFRSQRSNQPGAASANDIVDSMPKNSASVFEDLIDL